MDKNQEKVEKSNLDEREENLQRLKNVKNKNFATALHHSIDGVIKALKTERFLYSIYSWEFGTELYELTGKPYSKALTESEAIRYIKEALLVNEYILDVNVSNIGFDGSKLTATATVTTVYGEVDVVV